ncbi:MAG: oligosaccharide flippase family protein [Betaproteobacteria bacterium]|nr:oligosaccharide flippase family protein [Betaproteobacteria bacterium]
MAHSELLWVVTGQLLTLLLGMVTLKLLTTLLGPQDYGRFALGLTLAGTLNLFIYGPMGHAVARYFHICSSRGTSGDLERLVSILLRGSAAIIFLGGIVATLWVSSGAERSWGMLLFLALGYGVSSGTLSVYLADLNTRRERQTYALLQSADALLRLAGAVVLAIVVGVKDSAGDAAMAGFLLGSLASLLIVRFLQKKSSPPVTRGWRELFGAGALGREFGGYAFSITLFAIPAIFASYGDRWIIQQTLSIAQVGFYVALAQIANAPANLMLAVFSQTINPIIFQRAGDSSSIEAMRSSRHQLYRALLLLAFLLALVTGVSYVFGEWIVVILTSPDFAPYAGLLWVLVLAAAIFQIAQALAAEAFLYNRPFLLFLPKMLHASVFLGMALWLVVGSQLEGVAIAAVVAAAIYLPLVLTVNARAAKARGLDVSPSAVVSR